MQLRTGNVIVIKTILAPDLRHGLETHADPLIPERMRERLHSFVTRSALEQSQALMRAKAIQDGKSARRSVFATMLIVAMVAAIVVLASVRWMF